MKDNNALRTLGWVMLGVGYVAGAISFVEVRSSHPTVIWTILQNAATVISGLAVVCLGNFYWRRRRRGRAVPGPRGAQRVTDLAVFGFASKSPRWLIARVRPNLLAV
jgi:hypothetical protein